MCGADQRGGLRNLAFAVGGCLEQLGGRWISRLQIDQGTPVVVAHSDHHDPTSPLPRRLIHQRDEPRYLSESAAQEVTAGCAGVCEVVEIVPFGRRASAW